MARATGVILYEGPSMLDGAPIICIATGLSGKASRNGKTGAMAQTWILRADMSPREAVNSGGDASICGECPHRGRIVDGRNVERSCYVTIHQAPRSVWASHQRGIYGSGWDAETFAGRKIRIGSYGDPAAVPYHVWERVLSRSAGHTGYTHQWRRAPELARWLMASVESLAERAAAKMLGFRTFRVARRGEPRAAGEARCQASKEAGHKVSCVDCMACGGRASKARADEVIDAHGGGRGHFERRAAA